MSDGRVTNHAESQRRDDEAQREEKLNGHSTEKDAVRGEGFCVVLPEFHMPFMIGGIGCLNQKDTRVIPLWRALDGDSFSAGGCLAWRA